MHVALINNQTELEKAEFIKELLKHGANPNVHGYNGYTPLHRACLNGYISITKILLEYGANENNGYSSFETALTHKQKGIFKMIVFDDKIQ